MTGRILHIAFLLLALSAIGLKAQQNPILPGFHADPEVLYSHLTHRYYIYSTTDGTPHWGWLHIPMLLVGRPQGVA